MADKRISQLNAVTTPTGSDLLVIVNNNETKKITYANFIAQITGSETDLTFLNQFTSSYLNDSASFHTRINAATNEQDLSIYVTDVVYEVLSGSVDGRLDSLEESSGSYETKGSGILSGSISYTSLTDIPVGIVSQSVDIADFVFTTDTITNSDVTIVATDGDIVLNADGNVYVGSSNAGNGIVTNQYFDSVVGDINRINNGTGYSITDNLDNIINSIPSISSLNTFTSSQAILNNTFATTGSNLFNGNQTIDGSLTILTPAAGVPNNVSNWNGQGGWNQGYYSNLFTSGGTGTGLTVDVAAGGGGYITIDTITINTPGIGYTSGDIITINNENNLPGEFTIGVEQGSGWLFNRSGSLTTPGDVNVSGSIYANNLDGLISSSAQITAFGFVSSSTDLSSLNAFTASYFTDSASVDSRLDILQSWSSSLTDTFATDLEVSIVSSSVAATIGIISQNTGLVSTSSFNSFTESIDSRVDSLENVTSSYLTSLEGAISSSSQLTSSFDERYTLSGSVQNIELPENLISSSAQITELGFTSESNDQTLSTTSSVQFHDLAIDGTGSFQSDVTIYGNLQVWGTQSVINSTNVELSDNILYLAPSGGGDFDLGIVGHYNDGTYSHAGIFSDASDGHAWKVFKGLTTETTGAYVDTNGAGFTLADFKANNIYGGIYATNGVVSGSSQLTSSYDTRYTLSGSVQPLPNGLISGSSQLTSSYDSRYTLSGSNATINTGSLATTGSNSFNGNQTITGSLIVSSVAVVNGGVTIPTGSTITLTSGSSISVDSTGAITGSLTGSVFGIGDVSAFSSSVNSRINNIVSAPAGTISGSSQLTSSFDERYTLSGSVSAVPAGTISGSSQLTSSFDTRYLNTGGDGVWSGSAQVNGNLAVTSVSASVFVGGYLVPEAKFTVLSSKPMTFWPNISYELVRMTTSGGVLIGRNGETNDYGLRLDVSGSVRFTGNTSITGSLLVTNGITGTISATNGVISGSSQLTSSFDTIYAPSASYLTSLNGAISSSTQVLGGSGIYSSSAQLPSGLISGSSQLTSSYDTRYTLSGSVVSGTTPAGTISGSSQLTSSFDGRYTQTGSFNTLTASFNSFTASAQSVTTGSNSFNGTQTITGSLNITNGSIIASQITATTASLYLTSGSNLYVQNNGVVEITGSLNVSGTSTLKVPVLYVGTGSGVEGGEIDLAYAQSGSTTLTGSAIVFDIWQDRVRIFENGGTNRGGYFDISTLGAGVGTDLGKLTYFIEAYANVSYTLPGSYTNDVCRYSVVSTNVNVPTAWFNTSTYTFTPLRAGYWEIIASYDVYRNGEASLIIQKNGTSVAQAGSLSSVVQQITKIIYLNGSTDYINIYNTGVQANARTQSSANAFFQARFVGA